MSSGNLKNAFASGCCAAFGSLFGKLCGLPIFGTWRIIRMILFILMIILNTVSMTLYAKGLQQVKSSVVATVVSASSNYCLSALIGFLIFGEITKLMWWSGMFFIITGLLIIVEDQHNVRKYIKMKPL